jgi:hypothetical protein
VSLCVTFFFFLKIRLSLAMAGIAALIPKDPVEDLKEFGGGGGGGGSGGKSHLIAIFSGGASHNTDSHFSL